MRSITSESEVWWVLDCRRDTDPRWTGPDETGPVSAEGYEQPFSVRADHTVAEIILRLGGRDVHLVGAVTGREVLELTLEQLTTAATDEGYRRALQDWCRGHLAA